MNPSGVERQMLDLARSVLPVRFTVATAARCLGVRPEVALAALKTLTRLGRLRYLGVRKLPSDPKAGRAFCLSSQELEDLT